MLSSSLEKAGPKHSTSVPFSAVPLSVDEKKLVLVANPVAGLAVKALSCPQVDMEPTVLCGSRHSLLPFTLQMVTPFIFPVTVHLKVKTSPGQVGGAAVNCPATLYTQSGREMHLHNTMYSSLAVSNHWTGILNGIRPVGRGGSRGFTQTPLWGPKRFYIHC